MCSISQDPFGISPAPNLPFYHRNTISMAIYRPRRYTNTFGSRRHLPAHLSQPTSTDHWLRHLLQTVDKCSTISRLNRLLQVSYKNILYSFQQSLYNPCLLPHSQHNIHRPSSCIPPRLPYEKDPFSANIPRIYATIYAKIYWDIQR